MGRTTPIRIKKNDQREYARLVRNAKAKIDRVKKNYGIDLSSSVRVPSLGEFSNKEEFEQWKHDMSWFTNRSNTKYQFKKNEHNIVADKRTLNEIKRLKKIEKIHYEKKVKELENKPFIVSGEVVSTQGQRAQMMAKPTIGGLHPVKEFDFSKVRSQRELKRALESARKRSKPNYYAERTEKMKRNFIESVQFAFNSEADKIVDMLEYISADDFYELFNMYDTFDFKLYSSENSGGADDTADLEEMQEYLEDFLAGGIDMDLQGFQKSG